MKAVNATYTCDWCDKTATVGLNQDARDKDLIPPGWGILRFAVRPSNPEVTDWSSHKYHVCSRACAEEKLNMMYPRKADFALPARGSK